MGVLINAGVLTAVTAYSLPLLAHRQLEQKLFGSWTLQPTDSHSADAIAYYLSKDGRFTEERFNNGKLWLRVSGKWVLTQDRELKLTVDEAPPQLPSLMGKIYDLGSLQAVDANQMVLKTHNGQATYNKYH